MEASMRKVVSRLRTWIALYARYEKELRNSVLVYRGSYYSSKAKYTKYLPTVLYISVAPTHSACNRFAAGVPLGHNVADDVRTAEDTITNYDRTKL